MSIVLTNYFSHNIISMEVMGLTVKVHSNLKAIMDERGLSVRQVSRDIDYPFESVRILYNDASERYPRELLSRLCNYLDVSVHRLLIEKDEPVD